MTHNRSHKWWLLLCLPALLACGLWQRASSQTLDIGVPGDQDILHGFYDREKNTHETYRWSQPTASIELPGTYLPGTVSLRGTVAPRGTLVGLTLSETAHVVLPPSDGVALRTYRVFAPTRANAWGWSRLVVEAQQAAAQIEARPLGLLVSSLYLHSARSPGLPPLGLLGLLVLLPLSVAAVARLAGLPQLSSIGLGLVIGLVVAAIWHSRPLWVQQYVALWLAVLLVLGSLLAWMRAANSRLHQEPAASLLLVLVVVAGLIPLYLLLKYGLHTALHWHNLPVLAMLACLPLPWATGLGRRVLLELVIAAVAAYGLFHFYDAVRVDYATDFKPLFRGPRALLDGDDLYDYAEIQANHLGTTYKYPPFFALIMGPLTNLSFSAAIHIWRAFNTLLIVASAWMLWRWSGQPLRSWSTLALAYQVLAFQQLADTLGYAQVDIMVLAGLAAALWALGQQRWTGWAVCLALPAAIKLYPAFLVLHGAASRRWHSLLAFTAAFGMLNGLAVLLLGLDVHVTFVREVLPVIGGGTAWAENQTLNGFLNRLTGIPIRLQPDAPGLVRSLTYVGALFITALTWLRVRRLTPAAGFGLWIVTLLLLLPTAWIHYQVILLIPFFQAFVRFERAPKHFVWRSLVLYGLAWLLLCYGNQWTFYDNQFHGPIWALALSYKFYGLLLLWWGIAWDRSAAAVRSDVDAARPLPRLITGRA